MTSQPDAATATSSAFDLRGRRAVVTGVSAGIGSAIAIALAAAGANVAGIYKTDPEGAERTEAESRALGADTVFVEGDTGDVTQVDRLAELAVERFGGIDIWVNNAARLMVKPMLETTDEDWHGLLAANLHGYFYGCRAAGRAMVDGRRRRPDHQRLQRGGHPGRGRPRRVRGGQGRDRRDDQGPRRSSSARTGSPSTRSPRERLTRP